jgi:hypothetical protein
MRYMKWFGVFFAIILFTGCFIPWVFIESKNITVTGLAAPGTNFGRPGYFHFLMGAFFLLFNLTPRIWAKRVNLLITALNLGWAIRNYFVIAGCEGGECPIKKLGLYLVVFSSLFMLIASMFPDMKISSSSTPGLENPKV